MCVCVFLSLLVSACMCLHLCVCLYVPSLVCLQWHVCLYVWMWEFVSESASWSLCMCLFGAFHVLYDFPKKQHYQYAFWISINCYDNTNFKFILYLHVLLTVDKKNIWNSDFYCKEYLVNNQINKITMAVLRIY